MRKALIIPALLSLVASTALATTLSVTNDGCLSDRGFDVANSKTLGCGVPAEVSQGVIEYDMAPPDPASSGVATVTIQNSWDEISLPVAISLLLSALGGVLLVARKRNA